ncbi:MAG: hypothetical protein RIM72_11040 [Alphaproteobacteria bacterium]
MANKTKTRGTGITQRHLRNYSAKDIRQWAENWNELYDKGGGNYGAEVYNVVSWAESLGVDRYGMGQYEDDSPEDFAQRILNLHFFTKKMIEEGDADDAARFGVLMGRLITQFQLKISWEQYALTGQRQTSHLKERTAEYNRERSKTASRVWAPFLAEAARLIKAGDRRSNEQLGLYVMAQVDLNYKADTASKKIARLRKDIESGKI